MGRTNEDVRLYAAGKGVQLWKVSEFLGFSHESNFSRKLRHELPADEKAKIRNAVDVIALRQG